MIPRILPAIALLMLAELMSGCSSCSKKDAPAGAPSALTSLQALAAPSAPSLRRPRKRSIPSGPRFAILPGKGIGPIRIGATVATIERLMQLKCDELSETRCRFFARAVDFELVNGITQAIYISRADRVAGGTEHDGTPRTYGIFNGVILPDLMLGMTPAAIQEGIGLPKRVEKTAANPHGTEELHYYDGMILEYDRIPETGLLALGAVKIVK